MSTGYYSPERIESERESVMEWLRLSARVARYAAEDAEKGDLDSVDVYLERASIYLQYAKDAKSAADLHEHEEALRWEERRREYAPRA